MKDYNFMKEKLVWITLIVIVFIIMIFFTLNQYYKVNHSKDFYINKSGKLISFINVDGKEILINWTGIEKKASPINYSQPLKPNSVMEDLPSKINNFRKIRYTINSKGFRDKEYNYTKQDGTYRIILLGDSYVFGGSVNDNETFDYLLERKINNITKQKIEILNLGVWGFNTQHEVQRLKELGLKFSPDLVLLFYFENDLENEEMADKMLYYFTHSLEKLNISGENALLMYKNIVKTQFETTPLNVPSKQGFQEVNNSLIYLKNLSIRYNFSVVLFAFPSPSDQITNLKCIANLNKWPFVNLKEIGYNYKKPWIVSEYDKHPSHYAHKKISDFLAQYLLTKGYVSKNPKG